MREAKKYFVLLVLLVVIGNLSFFHTVGAPVRSQSNETATPTASSQTATPEPTDVATIAPTMTAKPDAMQASIVNGFIDLNLKVTNTEVVDKITTERDFQGNTTTLTAKAGFNLVVVTLGGIASCDCVLLLRTDEFAAVWETPGSDGQNSYYNVQFSSALDNGFGWAIPDNSIVTVSTYPKKSDYITLKLGFTLPKEVTSFHVRYPTFAESEAIIKPATEQSTPPPTMTLTATPVMTLTATPVAATIGSKVSNGKYEIQVVKVERTTQFTFGSQKREPISLRDYIVAIFFETNDPQLDPSTHEGDIEACGMLQDSAGHSWIRHFVGTDIVENNVTNFCAFVIPKTASNVAWHLKGYPNIALGF